MFDVRYSTLNVADSVNRPSPFALRSSRHSTLHSPLSTTPAFTLIELLVVVAIIALLISILLPSLTRARELAKRAVCASNIHQMIIGLHLYHEDNSGELPGRSGYDAHTTNYFKPGEGPDKPESNRYSDFSGMFPDYATDPDMYYCPSGPWRADSLIWPDQPPPWGNATWFYGFFGGHNIWGRYITYDYFGNQTSDYLHREDPNPPLPVDAQGNEVEFPTDLNGRGDMVLMTDLTATNHPPSLTNGSNLLPGERDGLNVGYVDGSVLWKDEAQTQRVFQWRINGWKRF